MIFALEYAARRAKLGRSALEGVRATADVRIGRSKENVNRMQVRLAVELPRLEQDAAERLCADAVRYCPFHQAVHGNADATLEVTGQIRP
jgi:organic hydroperoxide reductase OsmC/OhrA